MLIKGWPYAMKIVSYTAIASILLAFAMGCASAKGHGPSVHIPEGLVAVTERQKALVTWVRGLKAEVSKQKVESALGNPTERAKDVWVYHLPESDARGGYYVTATLTFDREMLSAAELAYGHETREPRAVH